MSEHPILGIPHPAQTLLIDATKQSKGIDFHLAYVTLIKAYVRIRFTQLKKDKAVEERNNGKAIL